MSKFEVKFSVRSYLRTFCGVNHRNLGKTNMPSASRIEKMSDGRRAVCGAVVLPQECGYQVCRHAVLGQPRLLGTAPVRGLVFFLRMKLSCLAHGQAVSSLANKVAVHPGQTSGTMTV